MGEEPKTAKPASTTPGAPGAPGAPSAAAPAAPAAASQRPAAGAGVGVDLVPVRCRITQVEVRVTYDLQNAAGESVCPPIRTSGPNGQDAALVFAGAQVGQLSEVIAASPAGVLEQYLRALRAREAEAAGPAKPGKMASAARRK
jgi:hypothetical protein